MKSTFFYGVMNSSKSAQLLMAYNNYTKKGVKPFLLKPSVDTRSGSNLISSRVGISAQANMIVPDNLSMEQASATAELLFKMVMKQDVKVIMIDEAQFLPMKFYIQVWARFLETDVTILAYGLMTDYRMELFDGSASLVKIADKLQEIKTECVWCSHKATHNLLIVDNEPKYVGDSTFIGDSEYKAVCLYHYFYPEVDDEHEN